MFRRIVALVFMLLGGAALAQQMPRMTSAGAETPIRVQSADVRASIAGGLAETVVRLTFFNPNQRQLEGELQFPLSGTQQITGFSLDIDGDMRPAVPVEKAKGRQVLEAEERRQVDPALLEQTAGNNFKLRIYPIPAGGTRTVELRYAEALARDGATWRYHLPLQYGDAALTLDVSVAGNAAPVAQGATALRFEQTASGWSARASGKGGELRLAIPVASGEALALVQEFAGQRYFMAEVPVSTVTVARKLPKVIGLLWDSSGSGAARHLDAELQVLDRYFKAAVNAEVRLTRLRDRPEPVQVFRIRDGNWDALRMALASTQYDGATALATWQPQPEVGEYLLFSDGLANYGKQRFPELGAGRRLYALNSGPRVDAARLSALAERSGGEFIAIDSEHTKAAADRLLADGTRIVGMGSSGISDLVADTADVQQGILRLAGKMLSASGEVRLTVQESGGLREIRIAVSPQLPRHPLAAWWWANRKIAALEGDFELQRAAIRRTGLEFGIPTRETSLIVLERLDDYVRHDIQPPEKYRFAFEKLRAVRASQTAGRRDKHLADIVARFEQKVAWWERRFPKEGRLRAAKEAVVQGDRRMVAEFAPQAPAAAPPPPQLARPAPAVDNRSAAPLPTVGIQAASTQATITLKAWQADAPYMTRMRSASKEDLYRIYLDERASYANSSAFFLDVAGLLMQRGQRELGLRVLSNLAEMDLENRHVLRVLGYRLIEAHAPELAIPVFEEVLRLAEDEPQSFRDLGLALAAASQPQKAIDMLYQVVLRPWDGRFADIELIALSELNAMAAEAKARRKPLDTSAIDGRFLRNLPVDLRVVLTWDADNSDMDLWVTDPDGERCFYGAPLSYQGGRMSRDFTGGYGPEEFMLREAKPGIYRVEANYFGSRQQVVTGATTLQLRLSTGFGTSSAADRMVTVRLDGRGSTVLVGEFEIRPK
jgi:tetratricopeptide (TPR) repeat protein